jgi:hypothetical protein
MYNAELNRKAALANKVARSVVNERTLINYSFPRFLNESSKKLLPILRGMDILGAIVAHQVDETTGFIATEDAREYIRFLTNAGYELISPNEALRAGLFCVLPKYEHDLDEKRFIIKTNFYSSKTRESFVYYSEDFVLRVRLGIDKDSIVFKDTGKRIGIKTPAGRLLLQFTIAGRGRVPKKEVFSSVSLVSRYKDIIGGHIGEVFMFLFPYSNIATVDAGLREQLKIQNDGDDLVPAERVQFIIED